MPRRYLPEFRRKVLDLLKAGRKVAQIATELGVTERTIYTWRNQELVDTGQWPGVSSTDPPSWLRRANGSRSSRPNSR